jgi:hypothetical protein
LEKDREYDNFSTRENDKFRFYCFGYRGEGGDEEESEVSQVSQEEEKYEKKPSKLGYLMFNNYYVDLDIMIPSPYIQARSRSLPSDQWQQGPRMSKCMKYVIINGYLLTSYSYTDLFYRLKLLDSQPKSIQA